MLKRIKRKKIVIWAAALICLILIICAAAFFVVRGNATDEVLTEDVKVSETDISQTVTAAGEIVTAEEENIAFSTSKYFSAMCAEENERVKKGQHLIMYSDGTYEDAPGNGYIISVYAPATGTLAGSSNYIVFAYEKKLRVDITVPEGEINKVKKGDSAEVIIDSDTSRSYTGKIASIKSVSTTNMEGSDEGSEDQIPGAGAGSTMKSPFGSESRTAYYTVSLSLKNDGTILPGMSAMCIITISEKKGVISVPVEAVRYTKSGKAYVVTVSGKETEKVYVTTGISDSDNVEIKEGLSGDETVRIERKEYAK